MSIQPSRLFTDHPASVGESYFQHMGHALFFTGQFALCTLACLLHAIVPGLCTQSASQRTQRLVQRMQNRGADDPMPTPAQRAQWSPDAWPVEAKMCTERH